MTIKAVVMAAELSRLSRAHLAPLAYLCPVVFRKDSQANHHLEKR